MNSTSKNISPIQQKKKQKKSGDISQNQNTKTNSNNSRGETMDSTLSFFTSLLYQLITLFIILLVGISILYGCKVSQSNILPTDIHCFPYENVDPVIKEVPINMNITSVNGEKYSQKIFFPYQANKKNFLLDYLRKIKDQPKASSAVTFLVEVIMTFLQFNYSMTNGFYHILNSYLPESVIIFLSPVLLVLSLFIFVFFDFFYFIYAWFSNMSWLFKENTNQTNTGTPNWKSVNLLEPFRYFFAWFLAFVFFWVFILGFGFMFPVMLVLCLNYALFSPLGVNGFTKINNAFQKISLFQFFKDVLKDKKQIIMTLFSVFVVLSSFSYFDAIVGILFLLIILLFWFGLIPNNFFKNKIPENLSKLTSYNVADKKCNPVRETQTKKKNYFDVWNLFEDPKLVNQKGGSSGSMIHSLKKLTKKLNIQL